jgi:hypothetical protein
MERILLGGRDDDGDLGQVRRSRQRLHISLQIVHIDVANQVEQSSLVIDQDQGSVVEIKQLVRLGVLARLLSTH